MKQTNNLPVSFKINEEEYLPCFHLVISVIRTIFAEQKCVLTQKYSARIKNSYLIYTKDFNIGDNELVYLPFYMTAMI